MSSLRFKGITAKQLAGLFRNADRETKREVFNVMREETYEIAEISKKQAPVDDGELEAAHKVVINRNQSDKAHYTIEVGGTINGVNVDEYAERIHEGLWDELGPKSIEKQAAVAPLIVGEFFLTRAFDNRLPTTLKRIEEALIRGVSRHVG